MITPDDIRNPDRKSGYDHVGYAGGREGAAFRSNKPYQANVRDRGGVCWTGPRRVTAEEAAQDYCDYINGLPVALRPKQRSTTTAKPRVPSAAKVGRTHRVPASEKRKAPTHHRDPSDKDKPDHAIYFVQEDTRRPGPIKIGFSRSPNNRIRNMQTGNPRPLRLVDYVIVGTYDQAHALEQAFLTEHHDARIRDAGEEWLRPTRRVVAAMSSILAAKDKVAA